MTTRIAIVDDHELLAQSLAFALRAEGFAATAYVVTDQHDTLRAVLADAPDVVLLDLQLGEDRHGLSLVRPLAQAGVRVLVVSAVTDECEIAATLEAGAIGFVSKSRPIEVLLEAARKVARGEPVTSAAEAERLLRALRQWRATDRQLHAPFELLTARERAVLRALAEGHVVTDIAETFVVSVATVRSQVRAILLKLGVGSQLEAVAMAHRHGWYDASVPVYSRTA